MKFFISFQLMTDYHTRSIKISHIGTCCAGPLQWGQSVDVIMYCKNIAGLNLQRTHRETITIQYMSTQYGFRKETVQNAKHLQGI